MKAYSVRQRISPSGGEKEILPPFAPKDAFGILDRTYASANLGDVQNSARLVGEINSTLNPVCIAMTIEEARKIVDKGPEGRRKGMGRFLDSLQKGSLVVLEPYGSDIDRSQQNREYLPHLASSGRDFPEIKDERVTPLLFGITAKQEKGKGSSVPFPENFTDTRSCDRYFFTNVEDAVREIANKRGVTDKEKIAGISVELKRLYTKYPEVALGRIRDIIEREEKEEEIVTICPHRQHLDLILQGLKSG